MRVSSRHRARLGGALAVMALSAGSLLTAAGPAAAGTACDWDPAGVILLSASTVPSGGQIHVGWNIVGVSCPPSAIRPVWESMSGPGFAGDETLSSRSGGRTVTVTDPPGTNAVWTLTVHSRFGSTELDQEFAFVTS